LGNAEVIQNEYMNEHQANPAEEGPDGNEFISSRCHVDLGVVLHVFLTEASIEQTNDNNW